MSCPDSATREHQGQREVGLELGSLGDDPLHLGRGRGFTQMLGHARIGLDRDHPPKRLARAEVDRQLEAAKTHAYEFESSVADACTPKPAARSG